MATKERMIVGTGWITNFVMFLLGHCEKNQYIPQENDLREKIVEFVYNLLSFVDSNEAEVGGVTFRVAHDSEGFSSGIIIAGFGKRVFLPREGDPVQLDSPEKLADIWPK